MNLPPINPVGIPALLPYNGWFIWGWTGWKGRLQADVLIGQWLAVRESEFVGRRYAYANAGSWEAGEYRPGDEFLCEIGDATLITSGTDPAIKALECSKGFARLLKVLDTLEEEAVRNVVVQLTE